jgi:predicted amidohydrolase
MMSYIESEVKEGAELIVFPELCVQGYITPAVLGEDVDFEGMTYGECALKYVQASEPIPGPSTNAISELTKKYNVYVVIGMSQLHPVVVGTVYNSAVLLGPRGIVGVHHKMHIPLCEKQFFYPGNTAEVFTTSLGNIGLGVCYDGRFPEYTRVLALKGAEIVCNIWAIISGAESVAPDPNSIKYRAYTRAQENGFFHVNSNRVGIQGKNKYTGHSCIAAPNGTIIAGSDTYDEEVIRATLYAEDILKYRSFLTIFRDRRPEMYELVTKPFSEPYKCPKAEKVEDNSEDE